jgi:hypothetical protein
MSLEEFLPGRLPLALRNGFDPAVAWWQKREPQAPGLCWSTAQTAAGRGTVAEMRIGSCGSDEYLDPTPVLRTPPPMILSA